MAQFIFLSHSEKNLFDYENKLETRCMRNDFTSISSGGKKHANDNHIMGLKKAQII